MTGVQTCALPIFEEIKVGFDILKSLGLRHRGVNVIACPSCARQQFDVIETVRVLEDRLAHITTPLTVSVIGCVVNGPGEALMTDIGFTGGGRGTHQVYIGGQPAHQHVDSALGRAIGRQVLEGGDGGSAAEHPENRGMGTTATIAGILGDTLFLAQVGDSRGYLIRRGVAQQITKDQSLMQKLVEAGELTAEEAEVSDRRNIILQALGPESTVKVDLTHQQVRRGDVLVQIGRAHV
mgnify:CR=1 FL=1